MPLKAPFCSPSWAFCCTFCFTKDFVLLYAVSNIIAGREGGEKKRMSPNKFSESYELKVIHIVVKGKKDGQADYKG